MIEKLRLARTVRHVMQKTTPLLSIRIPATSANLGAGFDCIGVALNLWNTFELHLVPGQEAAVTVESHGEAAATLPKDHTNTVARILFEELDEVLGQKAPGPLKIVCRNNVPCGSGLGSSSTAVIAGLVFAQALARRELTPENLDTLKRAVLPRAVEIEGHGDNVVPALTGGLMVITRAANGRLLTHAIPLPRQRVVVCVPDFAFLTSKARAVLPPALPRTDAVYNIGHAVLTIEALRTGDLKLLAKALDDRMHEPYRVPAIPGAIEARQAALDAGAAASCLSGAGPGILAFAGGEHERVGEAMKRCFADAGLQARYWVLDTTDSGAEISLGVPV
ncbi:MAG: homoserine kinase [Puniceicoccales bacterium]|jgi:homoserine kinase|nr:homoserine kinase [Puniceicoccales bacterium]